MTIVPAPVAVLMNPGDSTAVICGAWIAVLWIDANGNAQCGWSPAVGTSMATPQGQG